MKIILLGILLAVGTLLIGHQAHASDLSVVCDDTRCVATPSDTPLFQEEGWVPGQSILRTIEVTHNGDELCHAGVQISSITSNPDDFVKVLHTHVEREGEILFDGIVADMDGKKVFFDIVESGQTLLYRWSILLDSKAGNAYKGANLSFDFDMTFRCDVDEFEEMTDGTVSGVNVEQNNDGGTVGDDGGSIAGAEDEWKGILPSVLGLARAGHTPAILYALIIASVLGMAYAAVARRKRTA